MAPLVWVPWAPGNSSIIEQWVPEPINIEKGTKIYPFFSKERVRNCGWDYYVAFGNPSIQIPNGATGQSAVLQIANSNYRKEGLVNHMSLHTLGSYKPKMVEKVLKLLVWTFMLSFYAQA